MEIKHSFIFFLLLFIIKIAVAVAAPPIAKNNCSDYCGDVSIPYPFGIGAECYLNASYEISCSNQSPVLTTIRMEVQEISFGGFYSDIPWPYVRVISPIISLNCSGRETNNNNNNSGYSVDFTGTPFYYSSSRDIFVAAGCNNHAFMVGTKPKVVGCETGCRGIINSGVNGTCNGEDYCTDSVPFGTQSFGARLERIQSNQSVSAVPEGCKLAYLAESKWFRNNLSDYCVLPSNGVPSILWWEIDKPQETSKGQNCSQGEKPTSAICYCLPGYEGNPYLPNGCQDIDECKDPNSNPCGKETCVNKLGSYKCQTLKKTGIILGLSLGFGLLLSFIGGWQLYNFWKKRKAMKLKKMHFKRNGGLLLEKRISSSESSFLKPTLFSSEELDMATDHFNWNRILGEGGQGTVYKGMLVDGRIVAVKKSKALEDADKVEGFINEVFILSQIIHRNVVKLLGCCLETQVPLLVYEFISNGTLFQHLHDQNGQESQLSWEMRLKIATEAAEAISYLHSSASFSIYHRDIKSENILLDEKNRAKVSDFGISRSLEDIDQTHATTDYVKGTVGYLDPEFFQTRQYTAKSDVYSFGVVLVELITAERPVFVVRGEDNLEVRENLATHFTKFVNEDRLLDIVDTRIKHEDVYEGIIAAAKVAYNCLSLNGRDRPTMREVVAELVRIQSLRKASSVQHTQDDDDNEDTDNYNSTAAVSSTNYASASSLEVKASNVQRTQDDVVIDNYPSTAAVGSPIGYASAASLEVKPLVYGKTW